MNSVIYKIFHGLEDNQVHNDFVKFSKGVFENRYLIDAKKQKDKWSIKTSAEFVNFFVRKCAEKSKGNIKIKGAIICTFDLKEEISFEIEKVKQFAGVKQYLIDTEVDSKEIIALMEKYPKAFYALSFSVEDSELKIKAKPPKSGKPGKKGNEEPKAEFCSLKTSDREIAEDLFFDFPEFKEIEIKHRIEIKDIELPSGVNDPVKIRELAKRKGVMKRIVAVDGKKEEKEKEFAV